MITIRVRSMVWFATGALLAAALAVVLATAWRVDAAPGDDDSTFVPISPCRLMDTRPAPLRIGPNGTLSTADTTTVQATGTNGDCTIPADAVGLSMNVTALNATANTFLTFWPDGVRPLAASLNPAPGQPPTPNAVTVSLAAAGSFELFNLAGFVDVVIDVNGYHTKDSLQEIAARLAALEAAQPFAESTFASSNFVLTTDVQTTLSLPITAPVAGQVTLNYTAIVNLLSDDGNDGLCLIAESTNIPASLIFAFDESVSAFEKTGASDSGTVSGTRTFDIAAGEAVTYVLACEKSGGAAGELRARNLNAIFTPEP